MLCRWLLYSVLLFTDIAAVFCYEPTHDLSVADHYREVYKHHPCHKNFLRQNVSVPIDTWLKGCDRFSENLIWLTMADYNYFPAVLHFFEMTHKYGYARNSLMICLDIMCMTWCEYFGLPCYYHPSITSVAFLKFYTYPQILSANFSCLMVDIDLSFTLNPFEHFVPLSDNWDIQIQNEHPLGGRHTSAHRLINFGVVFSKPTKMTISIFEAGAKLWEGKGRSTRVAVDQGMFERSLLLPEHKSAIILDYGPSVGWRSMMHYRGQRWELGGELAASSIISNGTVLMHMTCYEKDVKWGALKAAGAWYEHGYYDPGRRTLSLVSPLVFSNNANLVEDVRLLFWLASKFKRVLSLPNVQINSSVVAFFRVFDTDTLKKQGFEFVEASYLYNLKNRLNQSTAEYNLSAYIDTNGMTLFQNIRKLEQFDNIPHIQLSAPPFDSFVGPLDKKIFPQNISLCSIPFLERRRCLDTCHSQRW